MLPSAMIGAAGAPAAAAAASMHAAASGSGSGDAFAVRLARQTTALLYKNALVAWRSRGATALRLLAPVFFLAVALLMAAPAGDAGSVEGRSRESRAGARVPIGPIPDCRDDAYADRAKPCWTLFYSPNNSAAVDVSSPWVLLLLLLLRRGVGVWGHSSLLHRTHTKAQRHTPNQRPHPFPPPPRRCSSSACASTTAPRRSPPRRCAALRPAATPTPRSSAWSPASRRRARRGAFWARCTFRRAPAAASSTSCKSAPR